MDPPRATLTVYASPAGDESGRGVDFGRSWRAQLESTWRAYQQVFREHDVPDHVVRRVADDTFAALESWAPRLAAQILGIASGSGLPRWRVAALNARSEVLAAAGTPMPGECSTSVYVPEAGPPRTIQTWDWHQALRDSLLVWQYDARPGWTVKTFTEFGLLGKIGVNSSGLGVHFNLLQHAADGGSPGVPVHLLARRVLDEAASVAEAEELVRSAPVSASVALTLVGYDGHRRAATTLEVSPTGLAPIPTDSEGQLRHTNHFLDPGLALGERLADEDPDTRARLAELDLRREPLRSEDFAERIAALRQHREDGSALCCHPEADSPWQTHVVVGLDVAACRLVVHPGPPCSSPESRSVLI